MNNSRADALSVGHKNNLHQHVDEEEEEDYSLFSNAEMLATLMVLLSGLALTAFVFNMVGNSHRLRAKDLFERQVTDSVNALSSTLAHHSNLVKSLQGLFHASDSVSRSDFNHFLESIDSGEQFPAATGISWNAFVPVNTLSTFEDSVRTDTSLVSSGYPEFEVHPVIHNEEAVVVTYIEPMQGNENAFGFNIASNPERLAAVEKARDTGASVISAPVTLAQESGSQKGFLMMLPTYDSLKPVDLAERRLKFNGLVVGVFRVGDLIEASFESTFSFFQVRDTTDGGTLTDQNLIYSVGEAFAGKNLLQLSREIEIGGRSWILSFEQSQQAHASNERWIEIVIFSLGILVSLLAASLFSALASSRRRALIQAQKLTVGLHTANQELSRSNADLSQFAHVASHDLQTPVRNVISAVELLEDHLGSSIDAETEEYFEFLRKSSNRMRALVSELLEYARLGRDAISFDSVDLNELLRDVRESTSAMCTAAGAELIVGKLPHILGDARQLQRVFDNLVVNAIKYGDTSRTPKILIEHRSDPALSSGVSNKMIQLVVSDNGQGIEERFWETVFVPFKRLHRHDDIAGSGLGLGICKQVIERHGGSIVIESSSTLGTTFLIVLTRKSQAERAI